MDLIPAKSSHLSRRYTLLAKLGQGGMGIVYRAADRLTRETVALKQVSVPTDQLQFATPGSDPTLALALEFRTLAGLRHPHIVTVLDYGFDGERHPYYTMQLIENAQPLTIFAAGLDEIGKIHLVIEMMQALVYLHRRGVIHRDLKPANVLVNEVGSVKVMDFGLAFQHEASVQLGGGVAGTLHYMAPELFSEAPASVASDLYAVGVILYELFVGQPPFTSKNLPALITTILTREPDLTALSPSLAPLISQLLAKTPEERFEHAEDVIQALCAATNTPLPIESQRLRESFLQASTFVGREAELTILKEALDAALVAQGSFWLIGGESGVGKSRLLDELRVRALVRGALVLRGQAVTEGGLPYQLWREIIRRLSLETALSDLEAGIFQPLVPDIATLLERDIPDVAELQGDAGQQRLVLTLMDVLKRQTQPLVLLLEDLQWAEEGLELLHHILIVRDMLPNLLVIGTYRDDECPTLPDELVGTRLIKLARLSEGAIAQLARSMLGATVQPAVVDMLQRETEGNVFFMVETVRALAEDAGTLAAIGQETLPLTIFAGGVLHVVQQRLNRLPSVWQPLLQKAAVAGRAIDIPVLKHLADGLDIETFLSSGLNVSLFEVVDERWRFSHDKLREGVLATLSEAEVRMLNRAVALALEASYPNDPNYHEGLMGHWRAAEDIEHELYYLLSVIKHITKISADYDHTIQLAARGLALLKAKDVRRIALLTLSSEAYLQQGSMTEAIHLAQKALALAYEINDQKGIAESLNRLGHSAFSQGDYTTAKTHHEQSLMLFREIGDRQGIANSLDGLSRSAAPQGLPAVLGYAQQSLALFREIGDKQGVAKSLHILGDFEWAQGDFASALVYWKQGLAIYREIADKHGLAQALSRLGYFAWSQGEFLVTQDYIQQSLALYRTIGDKFGIATNLSSLSNVEWAAGNYIDALDYAQQSLALRQELGDMHGVAESLLNLGYVTWAQGDYVATFDKFQQSMALARKIGNKGDLADSLTSMAALLLDQGITDVALLLREGLELSLDMRMNGNLLAMLTVLGRFYIQMDRPIQAALLAGLVDTHRLTEVWTRRGELSKLKRELQVALSGDELVAAIDRGKVLDLGTTVHALLDQSWE